jgi:hypothetical protein
VSRRNQGHRRRNYGRRQHEIRERRDASIPGTDWSAQPDSFDWTLLAHDEDGGQANHPPLAGQR